MWAALELKVPPLLLTLLLAGVAWWISPEVGLAAATTLWGALGYLLMVLGLFCITLGVIEVKRLGTTVDPTRPQRATTLVTSGIYRFSRNPMYLGFLLLLSGWSACLLLPQGGLLGLLLVLYLNRFQIKPEERVLTQRFGRSFAEYCTRTRRWL